jgi:16S rRNA (uracil1498-N3)-methyltransferase
MVLPRFLAPGADGAADRFALPPDEADHLRRVLRLRAGARVQVFDGGGHEFLAEVEDVSARGVIVRRLDPLAAVPEPAVAVTLAQAVLKGDRMDAVVRDGVMFGVAAIQPLVTEHTEAPRDALARGARVQRWARVAVASAKQCGRAVVPEVRPPLPLDQWLSDVAAARASSLQPAARHLMLVEPRARCACRPIREMGQEPPPERATLLVGPEGGWSDAELGRAAEVGYEAVTLGARTFRAEAAPLAGLVVLQFMWGGL